MTAITIEGKEIGIPEDAFQKKVAAHIKPRMTKTDAFALLDAAVVAFLKDGKMTHDEWIQHCHDAYHDGVVLKSLIELGYV